MRCALCEHGLEIAVHGWPPHRKVPRTKLDGWAEAHLVAATCSPPQQGAARWTLKLLGDHLVGLGLVDEMCKQLIADVRDPQPALPELAARVDYEYERRGMCSAFIKPTAEPTGSSPPRVHASSSSGFTLQLY